jgi:hypothetical protein
MHEILLVLRSERQKRKLAPQLLQQTVERSGDISQLVVVTPLLIAS